MTDCTIKGVGASDAIYDGSDFKIAIVHARWNEQVIKALLDGTIASLVGFKVKRENIFIESVPGSYELPYITHLMADSHKYDAVISIGVLIKGSTMHFEYIADAVSQGLMQSQIATKCPVIFGVLTCLTEEQAMQRAGLTPDGHNHGEDWGAAAVEMAAKRHLYRQ